MATHNQERQHATTALIWFASILALTLVAITGCSSDDEPSTPIPPTPTVDTRPTATPTPGPTATPFATPTAIPSPTTLVPPDDLERGGILRFAVPEGPPHMDPHLTVSGGLLTWGAGQSYSRLFKFDTTGDGSTVICDLCESWEQSAPLTFEVKLRDGIKWQNFPPLNGRALTAHDVVYSLNRQATPGYPNATLLSNIVEISATSDSDLLIRLESPDSEILEKLADSHSRIVAPEAVEENGDLRRGPTVGSGPWITSEATGERISLLANSDYYEEQLPYLDGLDIQVTPSEATRVAGMRSKIIDVVQGGFDSVDEAMNRFEEIGFTRLENAAAGVEIAMNTTRSPMDSLTVRQAMMLTLDPQPNAEYPGSSGIKRVFTSRYPQTSLGLPLINRNWQIQDGQFDERFNDIANANSLLTSAGISPTDSVVIKVGEFGQDYVDQANAMASGLASVGIRADVERVTTRKFGDEVWIGGDYDIAIGAPPPVSSTTGYLFAVHHSDGPWNSTGYSDPEIDNLIEAQAREYDTQKRGQLLRELQEKILEGSHRFIASSRSSYWMWWDYVHDFEPIMPRGDSDFLTRVWLTERQS